MGDGNTSKVVKIYQDLLIYLHQRKKIGGRISTLTYKIDPHKKHPKTETTDENKMEQEYCKEEIML